MHKNHCWVFSVVNHFWPKLILLNLSTNLVQEIVFFSKSRHKNVSNWLKVNVFRSAKSSIDPELAPVFVGIVRVISSAFSSLIMRKAHRKMLFMICMSITVTGNVLIATYSLLKSRQEEDGSPSYLVLIFCLFSNSSKKLDHFTLKTVI